MLKSNKVVSYGNSYICTLLVFWCMGYIQCSWQRSTIMNVRTLFTVCISTFLPFIENRCLEYQVIEKAHHVAHNETVGILSKKAQENYKLWVVSNTSSRPLVCSKKCTRPAREFPNDLVHVVFGKTTFFLWDFHL